MITIGTEALGLEDGSFQSGDDVIDLRGRIVKGLAHILIIVSGEKRLGLAPTPVSADDQTVFLCI